MSAPAQTMQLGDRVIFRDHSGLPKTALVTGTQASIDPQQAGNGSQVPRLEAGELHLMVFSPTGSVEVRQNIRPGTQPGQWQPRDGPG